MKRSVVPFLCSAAAGVLLSAPAFAQVQNESRAPYTATTQVFDATRVDNTIYVVGGVGMTASGVIDASERFLTFDPVTRLPTTFEMPSPEDGSVNAAVDDGAGGYYVGGSFSRVGNINRSALAHLTPTALDTTFVPGVNGIVNAMVKQGTTLYIAGAFTQVNGQARGGGAAFNLTTGALLPWNPQLDTTAGGVAVFAMKLSGSTIFLGGNFTTASSTAKPAFVAVDATTGAISGTAYPVLNSGASVSSMELAGSTLYLGGTYTAVGASARTNLSAIDVPTGNVLAFQATPNGNIRALLADGASIYAGGGFSSIGGTARGAIARLNATTGALDAWTADANAAVTSLVKNGASLLMGGGFTLVGGQARAGLAEVATTDGALSPLSIGIGGGQVLSLALTPAGLGVGGSFTHVNGASRPGLAAIDIVSNELLPLNITVDGNVQGITAVGNTLYLAGTFQRVNGQSRTNFAAVDRNTGALLPWNPAATGSVGNNAFGGRSIVVTGSTAFIGGYFTNVGGQARAGLAQVDAITGAPTSFVANAGGGGGVNRLMVSGSTLYVGGTFSTLGGQARPQLAAFDLSGATPTLTALTVTLTSATPSILSMKQVGNTLYFTGAFSAVNGTSRGSIAAITLPGGALTPFAPAVNGLVRDVDVLGATTYLAGGFSTMNGAPRNNFAAVDTATGRTTQPFTPDIPLSLGNRVLAYPEGLVAVGNVLGGSLLFFPATAGGLPGRPTAPLAFLPTGGIFLAWNPPAVGGDITGYELQVGTGPGLSNIGTAPTAADSPYFGYDGPVPPGLFYARVRALSAAGPGPVSPEMAFATGVAGCFGMGSSPAPSASVSGSNISLSWPDPLLFGPQTYTLTAGTVSGTANLGSANLGSARGFSGAAPAGAYFIRVQGQSACGVAAPSPEMLLSVGGVVPLEAPVLSATIASGTLTVSWTAVAGATGYRLEAGTGPLSANLAQLPLGVTTVSAPAPPAGTYYLRVVALGGPTGESHTSNEVVLIVP